MEPTTTINDRRTAAIGGVAFVVLWPLMIIMSGLDFMDEPSSYVAQVTDDAEAVKFSTWFGMLASVGFALFGAGLASQLWGRRERYLGVLAAVGTAVAAAVAVAGQGAILVAGIRGGDEGTTEPVATTLIDLGIVSMIDAAPKAFALVALALGLGALRAHQAAFGWISLVVAVALVMPLGISFFASFAFLAWTLFVAVSALKHADTGVTETPAAIATT